MASSGSPVGPACPAQKAEPDTDGIMSSGATAGASAILGHHGAGIGQAGESCQAVTAVAKDFNVRTEPAAAAPLASVAEEEQIEQLTRAERRGR